MDDKLIMDLMRKISDSEKYVEEDINILRNWVNSSDISKDVLRALISKVLTYENIELGVRILEDSLVLEKAFPQINSLKGIKQPSKYHNYDVYGHTIEAVKYSENDLVLRLTMLLHDIGKPSCLNIDESGKITFYGHGVKGSRIAYNMLNALGYSKDICNEVSLYVRHHMDYAPTEKSFNKMLKELGNDLNRVNNLLKVKMYDKYACKGKEDEIGKEAERIDFEYRKFLNKYTR